jgi:hypothetical protein
VDSFGSNIPWVTHGDLCLYLCNGLAEMEYAIGCQEASSLAGNEVIDKAGRENIYRAQSARPGSWCKWRLCEGPGGGNWNVTQL